MSKGYSIQFSREVQTNQRKERAERRAGAVGTVESFQRMNSRERNVEIFEIFLCLKVHERKMRVEREK